MNYFDRKGYAPDLKSLGINLGAGSLLVFAVRQEKHWPAMLILAGLGASIYAMGKRWEKP